MLYAAGSQGFYRAAVPKTSLLRPPLLPAQAHRAFSTGMHFVCLSLLGDSQVDLEGKHNEAIHLPDADPRTWQQNGHQIQETLHRTHQACTVWQKSKINRQT